MNEEKIIANQLAKNLGRPTYMSKSGSTLFFDQFSIADRFADLFGIVENEDKRKFRDAFLIATEGQGGEINKINSLVSSALLPLLVFFRLFGGSKKYNITREIGGLGDVVFDKCFFEVRNKVIRLPSCVDIALYSSTKKVMLFLESKFTEFYSVEEEKTYGKGYIGLYNNNLLQEALSSYIKVESTEDNLVLTSKQKCYIEGIKQSISHLIGLVRGPMKNDQDKYPEGYPIDYSDEYSKTYNDKDCKIYYGTILFDPKGLGENVTAFSDYHSLYQNTIGVHGSSIVKAIKEWDKGKHDKGKTINVLPTPITYQELFGKTNNQNLLIDKVKSFYHL